MFKRRLSVTERSQQFRLAHKLKAFAFFPETVAAFEALQKQIGRTNYSVARKAFSRWPPATPPEFW